ncbi:MAG: HAMP domain-containing sensor histidine kinase [Acidimicrobiales bacterium]
MTLRSRLLLGTAVIAAVLALSAVVITRSTRAHLVDQVDEQLRAAGPRLRDRIVGGGPRLSEIYVGRIDGMGALATTFAPDLRGDTAPRPQLGAADVEALAEGEVITVGSEGDTRYRMLARPDGSQGGMTVVAVSLDDVDEAVGRLVAVEGIVVAAVLGVLGLVTWWVMRLGVRPVRRMTATATAIAGGDLSLRVPEETPGTEAGALGSALNGMLGHIEAAFEQRRQSEGRLRQFVADASHELRTPITTIRGYAELHRSGALEDPVARDDALRRVEQESIRMGSLVEDLLRLARLDQGRPLARAPVDLVALAGDAIRDAGARAPERTLVLDAPAPVTVDGDEDALRQVTSNLLTNALVHAPGATVSVRVTADEVGATLDVSDDGPGMGPEDVARAFERFYRADASRSRLHGGSGLGLSIARSIVEAHGGEVTITSTPGTGTVVQVRLPLSGGTAGGGCRSDP